MPKPPHGLPDVRCVLPFMKEAAGRLPQTCTSLANIVRPWQREEQRTLARLAASGSTLVMFNGGASAGEPSASAEACDIDFEAVLRLANSTRRAEALLWMLRNVSRAVDHECALLA